MQLQGLGSVQYSIELSSQNTYAWRSSSLTSKYELLQAHTSLLQLQLWHSRMACHSDKDSVTKLLLKC